MEWIIWAVIAAIGLKVIGGFADTISEFIGIFRPVAASDAALHNGRKPIGEFEILYRDRSGEVTRRRIKPFFRNEDRDPLVTAYCDLRRDVRSFKCSRIIECIDAETGEVVGDLISRIPTGDML